MSGVFFLYFTVCLTRAPDTCESRKLTLDVEDAPACLHVAQPQLARWIGSHPEFRITAWRCGAPPRDHGTRI
jgi:hypothetical protein